MSKMYLPTLKEDPVEAEIVSHKLMLRAGMMRSLSAGVYSYLPLAYRVIKKIEDIIRESMDESGAQEVLLPVMQSAEIWKESGRWKEFGPLMIKLRDRKDREYCLGPTHEEVVSDLIKNELRSYKDLPFNLYQIQTKVRDEIRPRFGVMRGREFIMKDAYSLDRDYDGLDISYQKMYDAYVEVFENCGLDVRIVEADSGAMGGKDSHEFMVVADSGEDEIAFCTNCDYAANVEKAESSEDEKQETKEKGLELVDTPDIKTIKALKDFLEIDSQEMIKTMAMKADGEAILALVRGDDELNEIKLKNYLNVIELSIYETKEFEKKYDSVAGFIGPVHMDNIRIIADLRIKALKNAVSGANIKNKHYLNVNPGRDFDVEKYIDIRKVKSGDHCPVCGGILEVKSGIEVGHIFKLGTKYSENMGVTYLDENGEEQLVIMGSYGIGVTRLVAAAIEQSHDEKGIIWPMSIAPYQVIIIQLGNNDEVINSSEKIYNVLKDKGVEVLFDDRNERAGVKFNDAELIGIPIRVTIGKRSLERGQIEINIRKSGEEKEFNLETASNDIIDLIANIK